MTNKASQHILEVQGLWLTINQGHHVDTEARLQLRLTEQVVDDDFRRLTSTQIDHNPHPFFVRLIAQLSDALDLFLFHQLRNLLDDARFVDLIRNFGKDDGFLILAFDMELRAHNHSTTACRIRLTKPFESVN